MNIFVKENHFSSRREWAQEILRVYGNRSGFVFTLLDGKEISKDGYKKLLYQVLDL
jgi:hypothetical protein